MFAGKTIPIKHEVCLFQKLFLVLQYDLLL